ncbi:hypothetical protein NIES37_68210 [Tolypothrix tenuis PCC 7101]|uniref:BadM/Rrf2 family transcriptional regulator n=1 Tax=Tolypothrix tenuis PCC 7101 TaxID=231146 RepID=A0A1Z4NAP1_9CYAN|nr:Rrf2 family transcriptional regulator [Aulosira sp. FACHB-113]BAZ02808.1 hypothetical protein NIES37_68210 [Tolypothrix tenuis PCC 7101]BAZ78298.1 hypothetical protein NIES50_69310 [Aulosira laxa NIES-50]
MELSHKFEYALVAMLEIAKSYKSREPRQIKEIAEIQNIPVRYLDQLLGILRSGGLIKSIRGAKGGYILARKPENISVLDVYRCIERLDDVVSVFDTKIKSPNVAQEIWQEATDAAQSVLQKYTLFDLCEKLAVRKQMELMYYI